MSSSVHQVLNPTVLFRESFILGYQKYWVVDIFAVDLRDTWILSKRKCLPN